MSPTGVGLVLAGSVIAASAWASVQAPQQTPLVISGNDLGFQVERERNGRPVGKLVVRIDGKWVDAQFSAGVNRLESK